MRVSIVIPTYNEKENVRELIPIIFDVFHKSGIGGNLIIVDDNSPDGTAEEVEKFQEEYPIFLIKRSKKLGIGSAYIVGFKHALETKSDVIFEMDADFSHNPEDIPSFIEYLSDYDLVLGSRYVKGGGIGNWGIYRKIISKGANVMARTFLGLRISDITTGYRAYRKEVLERINLEKIKSNGYVFQAEMLFKVKEKGFRIKEIPINFIERRKGRSKLSRIEILNFFLFCTKMGIKRLI